ncbi:MAG: SAM-dependent chlorinase/fluorinase [Bacteroidota bacterium]
MSVITLTTEYSHSDYYIGAIKGAIISNCSDITVVDLAHDIPKNNIAQAAFILRSCYKQFPPGSIHLVCVNSEANLRSKHLVIKSNNHYFICADNGFPGLLFDSLPDQIIELETLENQTTFPELYVFASSAIHIIGGGEIIELGNEIFEINKYTSFMPFVEKTKDENIVLTGSIIYIDSYGNAITNISKKQFEDLSEGKQFSIHPHSNHHKISKINKSFFETEDGEIMAIFNSLNLLEIAQKNGSANVMLRLNVNDNIRIIFK